MEGLLVQQEELHAEDCMRELERSASPGTRERAKGAAHASQLRAEGAEPK